MLLFTLLVLAIALVATIGAISVGIAGAIIGCLFGDVIVFFVIIILIIRHFVNKGKKNRKAKKIKS